MKESNQKCFSPGMYNSWVHPKAFPVLVEKYNPLLSFLDQQIGRSAKIIFKEILI